MQYSILNTQLILNTQFNLLSECDFLLVMLNYPFLLTWKGLLRGLGIPGIFRVILLRTEYNNSEVDEAKVGSLIALVLPSKR